MVAALICAVVQMRVSKLLRNATENVTGLQPRPNIDFLVVGTIYRVDVLRQLLADLDGARCIVIMAFRSSRSSRFIAGRSLAFAVVWEMSNTFLEL